MDTTTSKKLKIKLGKKSKVRCIDLFAGTGAFTLALEKNKRFTCVFTNDMVDYSQKIYNLNHPSHNFVLGDLTEINVDSIPNHDLLCGGFPCQPFSLAGEKKGFEDKRSNVFWSIIDILKKHKPKTIILENVKNLKSHDKGNTYKRISESLTGLGYKIKDAILDTSKITEVPQHRERIYMVGFLEQDKYDKFDFDFPKIENKKISDFLEEDVDDKYYYSDRFKVYDEVQKEVTKDVTDENVLYQYRRFYVRENKSNCCPTLTANMGGGGHNVPLLKDKKGIRKLTPRECFNLQGFPSDYKLPDVCDGALYRLAGNAVSVPVVQLIANKLNRII